MGKNNREESFGSRWSLRMRILDRMRMAGGCSLGDIEGCYQILVKLSSIFRCWQWVSLNFDGYRQADPLAAGSVTIKKIQTDRVLVRDWFLRRRERVRCK